MSELADRLRRAIDAREVNGELAGFVAEAADELDRLGSIVGAAAHYTDSDWAAHVVAAMARDAAAAGPLFPPPTVRALNCSLVEAGEALHDAQGYWERHLQATGGR